jgi:hypothetical protein
MTVEGKIYMTADEIVIKAIQEEIACQSPGMQAQIRECYTNLRTVYESWGQAGPMALALLGAEEQAKS